MLSSVVAGANARQSPRISNLLCCAGLLDLPRARLEDEAVFPAHAAALLTRLADEVALE